jgi:predicted amidohydrolase
MKEKSKEFQITILGGSFPFEVDDEIRNIALMSFEDGTTYTQEKLFLTPDEIGWGWKPGHELKLFEHPTIGRFTIHICYDSEFPQMSTMIADFRPRVVFIPSMTGERGFNRVRWSAQARAVEHYAYVVLTGTVSAISPKNTDYVGQAAFLTPQDEGFPKLTQQGTFNKPQLQTATLDFELLDAKRKTAGIYPAKDFSNRAKAIVILQPECVVAAKKEF